jgi:hypothetical protein
MIGVEAAAFWTAIVGCLAVLWLGRGGAVTRATDAEAPAATRGSIPVGPLDAATAEEVIDDARAR